MIGQMRLRAGRQEPRGENGKRFHKFKSESLEVRMNEVMLRGIRVEKL